MILEIRPTVRKCVMLFPLDSLLWMGIFVSYCWWFRNHAKPVEVGSLSQYLQVFLHPRISSINSRITMTMPGATWPSLSRRRTKNSVPTWSAQSPEGVPACKLPRWACVQTSNRVHLVEFLSRNSWGDLGLGGEVSYLQRVTHTGIRSTLFEGYTLR